MASHYQNHVGVFGCEPKSRTSSLHKRVKERVDNQMKAKSACKFSHLKVQSLPLAPAEAGLCSVPHEGFSQVTRWQQQSSDPSISSAMSMIQEAPVTHPLFRQYWIILTTSMHVEPTKLGSSLALTLHWLQNPDQESTSQSLKFSLF